MKKKWISMISLSLILCLSFGVLGCDIDLEDPPVISKEQAEDIGDWTLPVVANGEAFGITEEVDIQELLARDEVSMVLIDFWASWCQPCIRGSMPALEEVFEYYQLEGLVLLHISVDVKNDLFYEKMMKYIDEIPITAPVPWDYDAEVKSLLGVGAIPARFLVDKEGKIRHHSVGYTSMEYDIYPLVLAIEYLLNKEE